MTMPPITPGDSDPAADPAPTSGPGAPPAPEQAPAREPERAPVDHGHPDPDPLRGSRTGGVYAALAGFGLVLVLLIIFIAQNTESAPVRFLGWEGSAPLAVSLLIAVAAGLLLATAAASARIIQLRRRVKKERKRS